MNNSISDNTYFLEYGLEKDPFPANVIDKNIFLTPEINRRLKNAKKHIIESQKLLLITSIDGAGKSLLAQKLIILQESDWRTSLIFADSTMDAESLSSYLIQQLLPDQANDVAQSSSLLHKYLETSYKQSIRPVIVIDNADKLPIETLRFVLQLAELRYNESLFRIVLFANESINELIAKPEMNGLADGMIEIMSMPSFSKEQIPAYLKYRLSSCGSNIDFPFQDTDIDFIYKASGGLPGGINRLSRKILQDALIEDEKGNNYGKPFLLLSGLLLALASYLFYDNSNLRSAKAVLQQNMHKTLVSNQLEETKSSDEDDNDHRIARDRSQWTDNGIPAESLSYSQIWCMPT